MDENIKDNNRSEVDFFDGKHLIFNLDERNYGIPIVFVNEIIGLMDITPVPNTPEFMKGVINLRGKIIPVLDLRLKLNMQKRDYDEQTCIIIVDVANDNTKNGFVGLVVDMVSEVYKIPDTEIEENFQYGIEGEKNYLTGIGKIKDNVVMLLDIKSVINFKDINQFVKPEELDEIMNSL